MIFQIVTGVFLLLSIISLTSFILINRNTPYSYKSVYFAGLSIFFIIITIAMLYICFVRLSSSNGPGTNELFLFMAAFGFDFVMLTFPLMCLFVLAMIISNISLLLHESRRLSNLLGILISLALTGGWLFLFFKDLYFDGNEEAFTMHTIFCGIYSTIFAYFECMLGGAIICGILAAKRKPGFDRDFIIILGCRMAADGTPLPILKGRIDRAIDFYKKQKEKSQKEAAFICSGGQGKNEPISEAECMKNYLLSQDIPEDKIFMENKSTSTYENMLFSLVMAADNKLGSRGVFSTTNYHVFRSGMLSQKAGFTYKRKNSSDTRPEICGIGAKTLWYFWPNAFMREFAGLMIKGALLHLIVLLPLIIIFYYLAALFL